MGCRPTKPSHVEDATNKTGNNKKKNKDTTITPQLLQKENNPAESPVQNQK